MGKTRREPLVVVYDGHCGVCNASMDKIEKMFGTGVRRMDFRIVPPQEIHPDLTEEGCKAQLYILEDGKAYGGAHGFVRLLQLHGWLRVPVRLYYVPPFGWLAERAYGLFARNRFRISKWLGLKAPVCTDACRIHDPRKKP